MKPSRLPVPALIAWPPRTLSLTRPIPPTTTRSVTRAASLRPARPINRSLASSGSRTPTTRG
jgi:hypothetical protein